MGGAVVQQVDGRPLRKFGGPVVVEFVVVFLMGRYLHQYIFIHNKASIFKCIYIYIHIYIRSSHLCIYIYIDICMDMIF